jgi:hypothetical protein
MGLPVGLPTMSVPTYTIKLLSVAKPVTYRPYLAKEEKILLMAQQSDDPADIERAVKQIITNCTHGAVDVDTLASFDLEYLFLQLRAKSVNNVVDVHYECRNVKEDGNVCRALVPVRVNLDDVAVTVPPGHTRQYMLTKDIGVTLRYPTAKHYSMFTTGTDDMIPLLVECLETVYTTAGDLTEMRDQTPEDVLGFVESLTIPQVDILRAFFRTLPYLAYTAHFACPKCAYEEDVVLQGLTDFFD